MKILNWLDYHWDILIWLELNFTTYDRSIVNIRKDLYLATYQRGSTHILLDVSLIPWIYFQCQYKRLPRPTIRHSINTIDYSQFRQNRWNSWNSTLVWKPRYRWFIRIFQLKAKCLRSMTRREGALPYPFHLDPGNVSRHECKPTTSSIAKIKSLFTSRIGQDQIVSLTIDLSKRCSYWNKPSLTGIYDIGILAAYPTPPMGKVSDRIVTTLVVVVEIEYAKLSTNYLI